MVNPVTPYINDIKYIMNCWTSNRKERLVSCCYWQNEEGRTSPDMAYEEYKENFEGGRHEDWCVFYQPQDKVKKYYPKVKEEKWKNLRDGTKYLGVALHNECHVPLELTQNRIMGSRMREQSLVFCWNNVKEYENSILNFLQFDKGIDLCNAEIINNNFGEIIVLNKDQKISFTLNEKRSMAFLNVNDHKIHDFMAIEEGDHLNIYDIEEMYGEKFTKHYHELGCLKSTLFSEINLQEKEKSTRRNLSIFYFNALIALGLAKLANLGSPKIDLLYLAIPIFILFVLTLLYYIWNCMNLNEAKDVLFVCTGVDLDTRKEDGKRSMLKTK